MPSSISHHYAWLRCEYSRYLSGLLNGGEKWGLAGRKKPAGGREVRIMSDVMARSIINMHIYFVLYDDMLVFVCVI